MRVFIYIHTYIHTYISCVVLKVRLNCEICRLPRKEILDFFRDLHCLDACVRAQELDSEILDLALPLLTSFPEF